MSAADAVRAFRALVTLDVAAGGVNRMLARMFGATDDGVHDRLTDFSRPTSGAYYFAPSLTALDALG